MKRLLKTLGMMAFAVAPLFAAAPPPGDSLQRYLFPPELIMRNQHELRLSDEQKNYIMDQMQEAQSQFTELRWKLQAALEELEMLLNTDKPDENAALAQLDRVLDLERDLKRVQLTLAIRIKGALDEEQVQRLERLKRRQGPGFIGPGPGPEGPPIQ